ncbi:hypothetical protein CHUAL_004974 [Chamberlinius hualienensis]
MKLFNYATNDYPIKFIKQNFQKMFSQTFLISCFISILEIREVQNLPFEDYSVVQMPFIDWNQLRDEADAAKSPIQFPLEINRNSYLIALHRRKTIFTLDAEIVIHGPEDDEIINASDFQTESVNGYVVNHPHSHLRGYIDDGIFIGIITIGEDNFYVEPADKYLNETRKGEVIIYQNTIDVDDAMPNCQNNTDVAPSLKPDYSQQLCNSSKQFCADDKSSYHNYNEMAHESKSLVHDEFSEAARVGRVCKLKVVGDHFFTRVVNHNNVGKAIKNMEFHIHEVDQMYRMTDFDANGRPDDIRVRVAKAEIFRNPSDRNYLLGEPGTTANYFLEKFTHYDHSGLCGAMAFSGRVFPEHTLGFAYRGGPGNTGGICYPRTKTPGKEKSMNVGMVTLIGTSGEVPMKQSSVLVAHELGHMFGSAHDESAEEGRCQSSDTAKQFIMAAVSNPGTSENNRRFSSCSKRMINANLIANGKCLDCRGRQCSGCLNVIKSTFLNTTVRIFAIITAIFLRKNIS